MILALTAAMVVLAKAIGKGSLHHRIVDRVADTLRKDCLCLVKLSLLLLCGSSSFSSAD